MRQEKFNEPNADHHDEIRQDLNAMKWKKSEEDKLRRAHEESDTGEHWDSE